MGISESSVGQRVISAIADRALGRDDTEVRLDDRRKAAYFFVQCQTWSVPTMDRKMAMPSGTVRHDSNNGVSLQAVQGLLIAIEALGANVCRCAFADHQFFIVAVPAPPLGLADSAQIARRSLSAKTNDASVEDANMPASLDAIFDATCRRLQLSRKDLVSRRRNKKIAVARLLIAQHAKAGHVISIKKLAAIFGREKQSNSLYVGATRLVRKGIPEAMMGLSEFLQSNQPASPQLQAYLGANQLKAPTLQSICDSELGARLSSALPVETVGA